MESKLNTAGNEFSPFSAVYYGRGGNVELLWDADRLAHRLGLDSLLDTIGFIDVVYVIETDRITQIYGRDWGDKYDSQLAEMQAFEQVQASFIDFLLS